MSRAPLLGLAALAALLAPAPALASPPEPHAAPPIAQAVTQPASPAKVRAAAQRIRDLTERAGRAPSSWPAISVVVATRDEVPLLYVSGVTRAGGAHAAGQDTPFYIASETKAFTGLLAARLDAEGVMPLDTTLAQVWPDLKLPAPADPAKITMRQLLSHQAPITTPAISYVTAYVADVPSRDYPRLMALDAKPREPGFVYANMGYLIYGAALEARTGRSWRDWMKREVLAPLGLEHTSPRTSDFASEAVTWRHQWSTSGWVAYPPKADAVMHAAGGMVISPADMGRWMQANLGGTLPARAQPLAAAIAQAQQQNAVAPERNGDFACSGYSLGWHLCAYKGVRVLIHGGTYTGVRSQSLLMPDLGVGITVMAASDSMTGTLGQNLEQLFLDDLLGDPTVPARGEAMVAAYAPMVDQLVRSREAAVAQARAGAVFGGWTWKPDARTLADYAGRYASPRMGEMRVSARIGGLSARLGVLEMPLEPAVRDVFGAMESRYEGPDAVAFARDAEGKIRSVTWNDETFVRVAPKTLKP